MRRPLPDDLGDALQAQAQAQSISADHQLGLKRCLIKKPSPTSAYADLRRALANPNRVLKKAPFTSEVVEAMRQIPRNSMPDMPDRIIAATALYRGVPVISRDGHIRASNIHTIW